MHGPPFVFDIWSLGQTTFFKNKLTTQSSYISNRRHNVKLESLFELFPLTIVRCWKWVCTIKYQNTWFACILQAWFHECSRLAILDHHYAYFSFHTKFQGCQIVNCLAITWRHQKYPYMHHDVGTLFSVGLTL